MFIIPPDQPSLQWDARRAAVVDFKHVPQLGRELAEWRDRLRAVLGADDLSALPHPMPATLAAIGDLYAARTAAELFPVARRYGARYVVASARLEGAEALGGRLIYETPPTGGETGGPSAGDAVSGRRYFLYDLGRPDADGPPGER